VHFIDERVNRKSLRKKIKQTNKQNVVNRETPIKSLLNAGIEAKKKLIEEKIVKNVFS
jgi:hypothetical protein